MFGGKDIKMPILWGSQNLVGADMSKNMFEGDYPLEYFNDNYFHKLEFLMANFNPKVRAPYICVRTAFCFKKQVMQGRDSNTFTYLSEEIQNIIENSIETFYERTVNL